MLLHYFLMLSLVVISALTSVLTKLSAETINATTFLFWRYLIALFAMIGYALIRQIKIDRGSLWFGLKLSLVIFPGLWLNYQALTLINASLLSFITGLSILVVFALQLYQARKAPLWKDILIIGLSLTSLGLVTLQSVSGEKWGIYYGLLATISYGLYFVLIGKRKGENLAVIHMGYLLGCVATSLIIGSGGIVISLPQQANTWLIIGFTALVYSVAGSILQYWLQPKLGTLHTSILFTFRPMLIILMEALFLGNTLPPYVYSAGILMVICVGWMQVQVHTGKHLHAQDNP